MKTFSSKNVIPESDRIQKFHPKMSSQKVTHQGFSSKIFHPRDVIPETDTYKVIFIWEFFIQRNIIPEEVTKLRHFIQELSNPRDFISEM
jgi:hypothetical protein